MSIVYNVIISQIDSEVQEAMDKMRAKMEEIQNSEQYNQIFKSAEQLQEITKTFINEKLQIKLDQELRDKIDQINQDAGEFNEKVLAMLEKAVVIVKKTAVSIYKKINSCSRAVRSHKKTSVFSKSSSGDSGDSDQPEPPRSTHLTTPIPPQRNRSIYSWRTTPGNCSMVGGGKI